MNGDFLDKTIEDWQPHYKEKLTRDDAREIIDNLSTFFGILNEWDLELNGNDRKHENIKKKDLG